MSRSSIKIVGASGQGLISIGEILAKGFKRSGYCVFGYREYQSLIKGGHGSYQLDISNDEIRSTEELVDVIISLNHHGFEHNLKDLKKGGALIHDTTVWEFSAADLELIKKQKLRIIYLPIGEILQKMNAKPILANVVFSAFVWAACKGDIELLKTLVGEKFSHKKDLLESNMQAIDEGSNALKEHAPDLAIKLPKASKEWKDYLLLTGSHAMGLGTIHAGVRFYAGYPMTPSSPLLSFIAEVQNDTGMAIKQAEDEITAIQMVSGAMHMGTRALTATSGGGFDLMTETISLNGMIENPSVIVLAQRPGPATGLPTWTAQADLMLAIHSGHGEFSRCVVTMSDSDDAFYIMNEAFNLAEEFQTTVIVMTDKHVAEGIYTQRPYDQNAVIRRGKLVTDRMELRSLRSADRYDPSAPDGISKRWLPGSEAATYVAQGDEHRADGSVDESAKNADEQLHKRMRKQEALNAAMPDPDLYVAGKGEPVAISADNPDLDLLLVGWGSTKGAVLDAIAQFTKGKDAPRIGYLHYTWLWPLKGDRFKKASRRAKKTVLIEGNFNGQLGQLLKMETGQSIKDRILKYDGRPFFLNELVSAIYTRLNA
jgi:2-oxoglutarate ferredoxin oxidoreductase subunit alpha